MTETLPATLYRDPSVYGRERASVFARSWQFLCHASELDVAGAFAAETVAGYPLLAVRGEDGVVRAFHNVCRHRAGPLTAAPRGRCEGALTCAYHGWSYALDGRLKSARDFGKAEGFDPRAFALLPLRAEVWRGCVFVNADADAASLAALLAPLDSRLGARGFDALRPALRLTHRLACNWKTYVENYLEGYHVPVLHPGLDAEIDSARYVVTVDGRVALHEAPSRKAGAVYDGLWAWVWPNLGVNVYAEGLMLERIVPEGAHATRLDYLYLMPPGVEVAPGTRAMSDAVTAEDKWMVERVQENLDAGVYDTGRLSPRHEGAVAAFQGWVRAALG